MAKNVTIYSTPECPYCLRAKEFLKENNIDFSDVDVSDNQIARQEMTRKSEQMGVPVFDIDGQIIVGFDKDAISKALDL
ncbi:MAG: glutaredoxin domain-containing protein [bacterium]